MMLFCMVAIGEVGGVACGEGDDAKNGEGSNGGGATGGEVSEKAGVWRAGGI